MSKITLNKKPEFITVFFGLYEDMEGNKKVTPLFFTAPEVAYFLDKKIKNKEISLFNLMPYYIEKTKEKKHKLKYLELNEDKKNEKTEEIVTYRKLLILDLSPIGKEKDIQDKINKIENKENMNFYEFIIDLVDYEKEEVLKDLYQSEYFMKTESADIFRLPIVNARELIKPNEDSSLTIAYFFAQIEYVEKGSDEFENIQIELTELAPSYIEAAYLAQEKISKLENKEIVNIKINICAVGDDDYFSQEYFLAFKKIKIEEKLANGKIYNELLHEFYAALYKKIKNKKQFIESENELNDDNEYLLDIVYFKSKKFVSNELLKKKIEKFIYSNKSEMLDAAIDIVEEDYEYFIEEMNIDNIEYEELSNYYEDKPLLKKINRIIGAGKSQDWLESLLILKMLYLSNEIFNVYLHDLDVSCESFEEIFNYIEEKLNADRKEPFVLILSKESPLSIGNKNITLLTAVYLDKFNYSELPMDIVSQIKLLMSSESSEIKYLTNEEFFKRIKVKLIG